MFCYPTNAFTSGNFPIFNNQLSFYEENPNYEIVPNMMVNHNQMINKQLQNSIPEKRDQGVQCNFEEPIGYY